MKQYRVVIGNYDDRHGGGFGIEPIGAADIVEAAEKARAMWKHNTTSIRVFEVTCEAEVDAVFERARVDAEKRASFKAVMESVERTEYERLRAKFGGGSTP